MTEPIKIRCLGCQRRFSAPLVKIKRIQSCPRCKLDGLWWEQIDKKPVTRPAAANQSSVGSSSPERTASNVLLVSSNSLHGEASGGVFGNIKTKYIAIAVVCLINLLGLIGGIAWLTSDDSLSNKQSVEAASTSDDNATDGESKEPVVDSSLSGRANSTPSPNKSESTDREKNEKFPKEVVARKAPPKKTAPILKSVSEPNPKQIRLDYLKRTSKALLVESKRFLAQLNTLNEVMKQAHTVDERDDEVLLLRREYDTMMFALDKKLASHEYMTKLTEFLELSESSVTNWRLAIKFQRLANNGRFSLDEATKLLERGISAMDRSKRCVDLASEAVVGGVKLITEMDNEAEKLKKELSR